MQLLKKDLLDSTLEESRLQDPRYEDSDTSNLAREFAVQLLTELFSFLDLPLEFNIDPHCTGFLVNNTPCAGGRIC